MRACVASARVPMDTEFTRLPRFRPGINTCMCIGIKRMTLCNPNCLQVRLSKMVSKVPMFISRCWGFLLPYWISEC